MLQFQSVDAELSRLAALAQDAPATSPQRLTPSQLAVLASAMGRKHGVKVVFGDSSTASTDGKAIVMPLTSKENSWIVRGYLDHEVGHVRLSNLNVIPQESPLHRSLWNILEDIRVERAMSDLYPGMATNLRVLISQLRKTKAGVFELEPDAPPEAVITAYVSLVLRSLYLTQPEVADLAQKTREQFLQTFGQQLEGDLFALISGIETATSTEDVVVLVGRIVDLLKQRAKEKPPEPEPEKQQAKPQDDSQQESGEEQPDKQPDSGDASEQESERPGDSDNQESEDSGSGSSENDSEKQDGKAEDEGGQAADEPGEPGDPAEGDPGDSGNDSSGPADPADTTDKPDPGSGPGTDPGAVPPEQVTPPDPFRKAVIQALESQEEQADLGQQLKALVRDREADRGLDAFSFRIAKPTQQSTLRSFGYRKHSINPSTSAVAKLSGKLRGLLQAQALDHAKPSAAGSRIARSRLHRIRTGESKLFLRSDHVRQVNTAIHLLVDNSGSMRSVDRFPITRDVCMALVKALAPIRGLNMGITIFPAYRQATTYDADADTMISQVDTVLLHGRKPGSQIIWPPTATGGTPLAESLRYVLTQMVNLPEPRKIVVILTDGSPHDHGGCVMALKEADDLKIEVVTLGIEDVRHPDIFPRFEIVKHVRDLPEKAFKLLERLLVK